MTKLPFIAPTKSTCRQTYRVICADGTRTLAKCFYTFEKWIEVDTNKELDVISYELVK